MPKPATIRPPSRPLRLGRHAPRLFRRRLLRLPRHVPRTRHPLGSERISHALHSELASRLPRRQNPAFEMGHRRQALGQALRPPRTEARPRRPQRPRLGRSPLSTRPGHQRRPRPRPSPTPLLQPDPPFATRVCAGDTPQKKPHPAPLRLALKQMCLKPSACVYVGDSPHDLEMSKRAGVRAIAVIGRFPTEAGLRAAKPEFLLNSLKELPAVLNLWKNNRAET